MFLDVAVVKTKKGVINGLAYQMKNGRGKVLYGFPETVKHWAVNSNSESTKAYSILVSFKETKKELEEKLSKQGYTLDELLMDIEELVFAGYSREEIAYSVVAHDDTDNFHLHIYASNNYAATGKTLKLWFNKTDFSTIKQFIDLKYGLDGEPSTTKAGRIRKAGSLKWKGEAKEREEMKDSIHEIIMKDVLNGEITDNIQVRRTLKAAVKLEGGTVKEYRKAIDILMDGQYKFSLRGGIYKEDWTVNQNISVKEVLDNLIRYLDRRIKETSQRYDKDRQKRKAEQPKYREEIMGKNLLSFLKQLKQNQQQNQQNQNQQPQKQTQPQKQNQPASQPAPAEPTATETTEPNNHRPAEPTG
jgi:hypothetical protein